jgi:AcrR family transcriptional regulator
MPKNDIEKKSQKKEILLQTAERLFLQKGIRSVTVEEIISQAQVSKATFYKYFSDKKDILEKGFQRSINHELEHLGSIVEQGKRDRLTLEDFIKIFDMNEYSSYFQSDFLKELVQEYPDIRDKYYAEAYSNLMLLYKDLMRMAKIDGIIRMDMDTDILIMYTNMMSKAVRENLNRSSFFSDNMNVQEFYQKIIDLYLYGIVEREESKK